MIYSQACRLDNLSVNNGGNAYFFTIIHIIFSISNSQAAKIRQMMPNCRIFNSFLHSLAAICGRHHFRYDYYEKHFLIMVIIFLVPPKKQGAVALANIFCWAAALLYAQMGAKSVVISPPSLINTVHSQTSLSACLISNCFVFNH